MKLKHNFISFGKVNFKKILNIFTKIEKKTYILYIRRLSLIEKIFITR